MLTPIFLSHPPPLHLQPTWLSTPTSHLPLSKRENRKEQRHHHHTPFHPSSRGAHCLFLQKPLPLQLAPIIQMLLQPRKGSQQVLQQMKTKIQRTQPLLYSLHQNPTFLPLGSRLIFQCPFPTHHSALIQTSFSLFRHSLLQHGKLILSFLSFQHPWLQNIPH